MTDSHHNNEVEKMAALRQALIAGEESGPPVPFNMQDIIAEARQEVGLDVGPQR